jgi:8-oxo-dGTP pyrophosphatase MutT (NUDIX family)
MKVDELAEITRRRLGARQRRIAPDGPLIKAAVLLPIVDRGEPMIMFTKRTDRVGSHKGQISFPGGVVEPTDATLLDAALRECEEEIALPRAAVEPLGALDDTETVATSFVITPFVGLISKPVAWQPDGEEVERIIEVPYAALVEEGSFRVETVTRDGITRPVYYFDYEGDTIWGATARILVHYLELVKTLGPERTRH